MDFPASILMLSLCFFWLGPARAGGPDLPPSFTAAELAREREAAGDLRSAEILWRAALRDAETRPGAGRPEVAALLSGLSGVLHSAGRDREGYPLARLALAIAETAGDTRLTAICLARLGLILAGEGEFARAEPLLRRSLALLERSAGPGDLDTAIVANDLATVYSYAGRLSAAEQLQRHALAVYEKSAGGASLAGALGNMFLILSRQGRTGEGEPYLRRAVAIAETTGPRSPAMAHLMVCLASLECSRKHYLRAGDLLEAALALQEQTLGPDHPAVARTLVCYSAVQRRLRRKDEARRAENRAQTINSRNSFSPAE